MFFPCLQTKTIQSNTFSVISVLYVLFLTGATEHAQPEGFASAILQLCPPRASACVCEGPP